MSEVSKVTDLRPYHTDGFDLTVKAGDNRGGAGKDGRSATGRG